MLRVVLFAADLPEVSLEGLATTGRVFLLGESLLVSGDGLQVLATSLDRSGYRAEACTCARWEEEELRQLYKLRGNAVIDLQFRRQNYCFFTT